MGSPSCSQLRSDSVGDLDSHSLCSWVAQVTSDLVSSSAYLNDWPLKPQNESNSPRGIPQTASGFAGVVRPPVTSMISPGICLLEQPQTRANHQHTKQRGAGNESFHSALTLREPESLIV